MKYKLTEEKISYCGNILYRIQATEDYPCGVKCGELGGFVESTKNLSDNAWVSGDAMVSGDARVSGDACVRGNARVSYNARVSGDACVRGNARVSDNADYIVFKNWWSSGRYFTWTRSNNMWSVGCFFGTGKELIAKAYKDSETSGREYERIVNYVESIIKTNENER